MSPPNLILVLVGVAALIGAVGVFSHLDKLVRWNSRVQHGWMARSRWYNQFHMVSFGVVLGLIGLLMLFFVLTDARW